VWNFALEELGRMNINFDPAWMSGKKQNWQNSLEFCEYRLHRVCLRKLLEWGWLFASACQNTIRSTLIPCNLQGKNFLYLIIISFDFFERHLASGLRDCRMSVIYCLTQSRAYYRFCIVQIVVASIYSIMIVVAHPWGVTKTEFQTTSCFLAGKDWNIKPYCNDVAFSQCRDSKLSLFSNMLVICVCLWVCVREGGLCVLVCVCVFKVCVVCLVCTNTDLRRATYAVPYI
jgi:hypothetical protein